MRAVYMFLAALAGCLGVTLTVTAMLIPVETSGIIWLVVLGSGVFSLIYSYYLYEKANRIE